MFNIQFINQILHPFILYALLGTTLGYLLVRAAIMVFGIRGPKIKITLLFLPVLAPFLTLGFKQFFTKTCIIPLGNFHRVLNPVYQVICNAGNMLAYILMPLSILTIILAVVKGVGSLLACRRLTSKYGYATLRDYPKLIEIMEKVADKAGIKTPRLVVTSQKIARCFTFGVKKPVIVITQGTLNILDNDELETVLAHEAAHILRGDSLLNWITVFFRDMLFFTPAMYFVFRDIMQEKEKASDDIALELTDKHYAFGEALIKVWRMSPKNLLGDMAFDNFSLQPNFIKQDGILEARLVRIIEPDFAKKLNLKTISFLSLTIMLTVFTALYFVC